MTEIDVDGAHGPPGVGQLLAGRFRIDALLGQGGMATVFLAEDQALGRQVAIKVFRRDLADGEDLRRQQEEISTLAGLNHPSLVTLFDATTDEDGNAFLVMELVDGTDLRSRLHDGPLPPHEVAVIGQHLADALSYVHAKGVVHRDIKPGNILLPEQSADDTGPQAKLADFGIARIVDGTRLTATGQVLGTASYFAPEQAIGNGVSPASDIYSLGLVLLECLTGKRAFPGTAVESLTARLGRDPDVPASLGDSWVGILRGMTTREPDARPTARDVSGVLARLSEPSDATMPYPAAATPTEEITRETMREAAPTATAETTPSRRRVLLIVAAVAAVLIAALLATAAISSGTPRAPEATTVEYPAVDGPLGTHLEQLQRTVEP